MELMKRVYHPEFNEGFFSIGKVLLHTPIGGSPDDVRVAMKDVCEKYGWPWSKEQQDAYDDYVTKFVNEYRAARSKRTPDQIAEEEYELRATFGPGKTVVNVFTGERTVT